MKAGIKTPCQKFNFTYRYIDGVLSLNNSKFSEYLEFIYPHELEIKETSEMISASSYLSILTKGLRQTCLLQLSRS